MTKRCLLFFLLISLLAAPRGHAQEEKATLKVGTKVVYPFAFKKNGQWTGISIELWDRIAAKLKVRYEWGEAKDTNDLVEKVKAGDFDVGIAAITIKPSRSQLVDFSDTMFKSSVGIASAKGSGSTLAMLQSVFSMRFLQAVGGLAAVLGIIGLMIWLLERRKNPGEFKPGLDGIWEGFWWSAVTMTTVGYGDKSPRSFGGRILGLIWMFASIIMISAFTAAIASSLTAAQLQSTINGPEDLPRVRVGAKRGESPFALLGERGIRAIEFDTLEDGLAAVAARQIDAFVHDTPVLKAMVLADPRLTENVVVLDKPLREERYGICFTKPADLNRRNMLRDKVNQALIELEADFSLSKINAKYLGD